MEVEYAFLLRQCTKFKAITEGRRLHSELHLNGYGRRTFIANLLVQMYASCGELEQAKAVFDALEAPNVYSWNILLTAYTHKGQLLEARRVFDAMPPGSTVAWNSMISAYCRNGSTEEAEKLFNTMSGRDLVTWNTMAAAYAGKGHLQEAMLMLESMPAWNVVSWNPVISRLAAQGDVDHAKLVFDRLVEKDVVSWTAMVSAYAQAGQVEDALRLFAAMDVEGVPPNKVTFTAAIDAYSNACTRHSLVQRMLPPLEAFKQQLQVLCLMHQEAIVQGQLVVDATVGNALLNVYGKCSKWPAAKQVFESMPIRDVVSWTSMAAAAAFDFQLAGRIFRLMPQRDSVAWTSVVAAFAKSGHLLEAEILLAKMPHGNAAAWNSVSAAYAQSGDFLTALKIYLTMLLHGQRPDRSTFVVVVEACAALASIAKARIVHNHVVDCCCLLDPELSTSLLHMYGRCGDLEAARRIFNSMLRLDAVPWNAMINLYAQSSNHGQEALELFHSMVQDGGFSPDPITSMGVLTSCSSAGGLEAARTYFCSLMGEDFGVAAEIDHYICILDLLGRAGLLEEAEELVDSMPFHGDELVWLALLSACKMHGDVDRAERAARQAFELGAMNSAPYVLLGNAFTLDRTGTRDPYRGFKWFEGAGFKV